MVQGAIAHSEASYAVAVSGVAGPGGGSVEKPVGTVWVAWGSGDQVDAVRFQFEGDRDAVREQTIDAALQGLLGFLSPTSFAP